MVVGLVFYKCSVAFSIRRDRYAIFTTPRLSGGNDIQRFRDPTGYFMDYGRTESAAKSLAKD